MHRSPDGLLWPRRDWHPLTGRRCVVSRRPAPFTCSRAVTAHRSSASGPRTTIHSVKAVRIPLAGRRYVVCRLAALPTARPQPGRRTSIRCVGAIAPGRAVVEHGAECVRRRRGPTPCSRDADIWRQGEVGSGAHSRARTCPPNSVVVRHRCRFGGWPVADRHPARGTLITSAEAGRRSALGPARRASIHHVGMVVGAPS